MQPKTISNIEEQLEKVLDYFKKELSKVHVSRATPSLVEDLPVNYAGERMPLKQLASIGCPSSNELRIEPWNKDYMRPIEKAITRSDLDLNPQSQEKVIYIKLPKLSQERREQINQMINKKTEEVRETIRHWWDEGWEDIKEQFEEDEITEDEKYQLKDQLKDLVGEYRDKIDQIKSDKQKEVKGEEQ